MEEAHRSFENGQYFSAAATAAIEFERAVRETARLVQLRPELSLGRIVRELADMDGDTGLLHQLVTLVKMRNGLIHTDSDMPVTKNEAEESIAAFQHGIDWLRDELPQIDAAWRERSNRKTLRP
jgi:hypothetical protein